LGEIGSEVPTRPAAAVPEVPPSTTSRLRNAAAEIATTAVLAVVIYLIVQTFVVQTYQIHQQSMVPTLRPREHLLVDKLTPRFDDYSRGDVVVFRPPDAGDDETPFIKRVIGVAGETVQIRDGGVAVNGIPLAETYVATDGPTEPICGRQDTWVVPAGELFLLGDHRSASDDSRCFGTVGVDRVIGRAWLRFWPLDTLTILQTPQYPELAQVP
jgi:signal peptidase I